VRVKAVQRRIPSFNEGVHMFELNERVVYPGHGVALINRILEKKVGTELFRFYELKFLNKEMTILVPVTNIDSVGIRKLSSQERINTVFKILGEPSKRQPVHPDTVATNWNKRNKEYQCKIRSGDLKEICEIYRDLKRTEGNKELTFGEKGLLSQTETLLAQEIALVKNVEEDKAAQELRICATQINLNSSLLKNKSI
jgi:CarD family transcriptional regulator